MRFDRESWRRLYRHEPLEQRAWPLFTRAIRDHLVRYPDELDGYLLSLGAAGGQQGDNTGDTESLVVAALCKALGAHDDERPFVERGLRTLLGDRYIVCEPSGIVSIRNFGEAQQSKEARKKAKQRARGKGDKPGTTGGHGGGQIGDRQGDTVGDNQGDIPRGRVRAEDETRRDEKDPPTPSSDGSGGTDGEPTHGTPGSPANTNPGTRRTDQPKVGALERLMSPPGLREDVKRLHELFKSRFGLHGHKFRGAHDLDAVTLAEALDTHGEPDCRLVCDHAPSDPMVNGKGDERGLKHDSIKYIFGNAQTFARILREAQQQARTAGESIEDKFTRLEQA